MESEFTNPANGFLIAILAGTFVVAVALFAVPRFRGLPLPIRVLLIISSLLIGQGTAVTLTALGMNAWFAIAASAVALLALGLGGAYGLTRVWPTASWERFSDPDAKVVSLDYVVRLLNLILVDAIHMEAPEIVLDYDGKHGQVVHNQPDGEQTIVTKGILARAAESGLYHGPPHIPLNVHRALVTRVRVMAGLEPTPHAGSQEGYLVIRIVDADERVSDEAHFAVTILPGSHGETAVRFEQLQPPPPAGADPAPVA